MGAKEDKLEAQSKEELIKKIREMAVAYEDLKNSKKEIADMTKAEYADYVKSEKVISQHLKVTQRLAAAHGDIGKARDAALAAQKKIAEMEAASLSRSDSHKKAIEANHAARAGADAAKLAELDKALEKIKAEKDEWDEIETNQKEYLDNLRKTVKAHEDEHGKLEEKSEQWKEVKEEAEGYFKDIGAKMIGLIDSQNHWTGHLTSFVAKVNETDDAWGAVSESFFKVFNASNLWATAMSKVVESTFEMVSMLDKAATSFAAATGTGAQYTGMLHDMVKGNSQLGLTFENAGAGLQGMMEGLIGFTNQSSGVQAALSTQAGLLERVGVKAEDSADLMNTFSKTMGLGAQASMEMTKQLAFMGDRIGISSSRMIKDFQNSQKTLAVYGKKGVGVFQNLAAGAKAAGVEMNSLLSIAEKFDTFESAAESAGKLNAILGGNLSATQMLMQTEDERVESVIKQIQISGQSFKDMDRFKQKAVANAVGITDMAEANRIFGMSMSEYKGYQKDMKSNELSQKKWEEAIKSTVPIQEKLQAMMIQFAPDVTALLDNIRWGLDMVIGALHTLNSVFGGYLPHIIMAMGAWHFTTVALGGAMGVLNSVGMVFNKMLGGAPAKIWAWVAAKIGKTAATDAEIVADQTQAALTPGQILAMEAKTAATTASAAASWGAAAAVLAMGGAIFLAAAGFALLALSLQNLDIAQLITLSFIVVVLTVGLYFMIGALAGLGAVGATVGWAILAIGAALFLMGAGVALAALAMTGLVMALGEAGVNALAAGAGMLLVGAGVYVMALAMAMGTPAMFIFGQAAGLAALGTLALGVAMLVLGLGLVFVGTALNVVAEGLSTIAEIGTGASTVILALGGAFAMMAVGLGLMFAFMSNPIGWAVIGGALLLMGAGITMLVAGIAAIDGEKLSALSNMADKLGIASAVERTVIAVISEDVEQLKEVADAKLATTLGALAMLEAYQTITGINMTKAETKVEEKKVMEQRLTLNLKQDIALGKDKKFSEHVKDGLEVVFKPGGGGDDLAETIVAKGTGAAAKLAGG